MDSVAGRGTCIARDMTKPRKQNFSGFKLANAYQHLGITTLEAWDLSLTPLEPSDFFRERLNRLQQTFDLRAYEKSKELLIDAVCEEVLYPNPSLKVWKGAALSSDTLTGNVDYLVTDWKDYLDTPFLCIVEAKRDDFEQGLAQCLVEMLACRWNNKRQYGELGEFSVFGIVTNADTWRFYELTATGSVRESLPYAMGNLPTVLGALRLVFDLCAENCQALQS